MPPPPPRTVAVVGAGLSGLTAAYRLATRTNARVTLIDATPRAGGWVRSRRHAIGFKTATGADIEGEIVTEAGPRSIRPRGGLGAPAMLKLICDVGLHDSILPIPMTHPSAKNRYLLDPATSALSIVDVNPVKLLTGKMPAAVRNLVLGAAAEPFRFRNTPKGDESVADLFARRFGVKAAGTTSAFVHGIYAADPAKLSVRSTFAMLSDADAKYGSVVLGMMLGTRSKEAVKAEQDAWDAVGPLGKEREAWSMYALRGGMESLTAALQAKGKESGMEVRSGAVQKMEPAESGVTITLDNGETVSAEHVVAALPSRKLDPLLSTPLPNLSANPSTTVGVINVVYPLPPSAVHPDGFGYLIPRGAPGSNPEGALGVVFDSTALPGIDGLETQVTKLTVMAGGPHWSSYPASEGSSAPLAIPQTEQALGEVAVRHLNKVFPHLANVKPLLVLPSLNRECIPTYAPGHAHRLRETHEAVQAGPWAGKLSVAGSGYGGVSVNDVVYSGDTVAQRLAAGDRVTGLERWAQWV